MKKKELLYSILPLILVGCNGNKQKEVTKNKQPNVIFFLVDDLGWKDLACYGNEIHETPNIDKLASEGMLFTNAYASCPVCSPTRASILTGKYPATLHLTDYIPGKQAARGVKKWQKFLVPSFHQQLPHEETTIAEKLKENGYSTAHVGKWHLGDSNYFPTTQGFDINIGGQEAGMPATYYYPYISDRFKEEHKLYSLKKGGEEGEYLTDRLAREAINFIEEQKDSSFFVYLSFYSVHFPWEGPNDLVEKYKKKLSGRNDTLEYNPHYAAMVESVDKNVGRVMKSLKDNGLDKNTLVIFASDNGGEVAMKNKVCYAAYNAPLREGKGTLYEGGIRVPTIIKWPGKVKPGTTSDAIVTSPDFYPTILEALGIAYNNIDGISLLNHLTKNEKLNRDAIYWHYPHYHRTNPAGAIREGNYKLIEYYENDSLELYDLAGDIGESTNLSSELPGKAKELHEQLKKWRKSVKAQMPTLNPDYDGSTRK